jgi:Protein of unknown function (DUF2752)
MAAVSGSTQPVSDSFAAADRFPAEALAPDPAGERRWHWIVLVGACAVIGAGWLVDVEPDGAVGLIGAPAVKLPVLCPSRQLFGVDCPGCGMTRSVTHLLHGRLADSFAVHRLGWLVLAAVVFQVPYRSWRLAGGRSHRTKPRVVQILLWGFFALLIVNWLLPR